MFPRHVDIYAIVVTPGPWGTVACNIYQVIFTISTNERKMLRQFQRLSQNVMTYLPTIRIFPQLGATKAMQYN